MPVRHPVGSRRLRLLAHFVLAGAAGSCGKGDNLAGPPTDPPDSPPGPVAVASMELVPGELNLSVGQTSQLTATARAADGSALTGRAVTWASGAPGVATVGSSGVVSAVAAGQVEVTATSEGKTATAAVTVSAIPVATVEVVPSPSSVAVGQTAQLAAVPKAGDGAELIGRPVTWATSDPAIATVSDAGLVTGIAVGHVTITATSEGQTGSSRLTVSAIAVATVQVAPPTSSIAEGATVQLAATAKDANDATLPGRPATWTTSNAGVARVNATGRVTGVGAGTATLTATIEGKTGSASVTVTPAVVSSVEVSPGSPTVVAGQTVQLTATVKAAGGEVLPGRPVAWASSADSVATVSATGLVAGVAPGTATITATSESISGTATVTVSAVSGTVRTWIGGASGQPSDWSTAANWNPAGEPIALDTARVPVTVDAAVLSEDVRIARLIVAGGRLRTAGHRLDIQAPQ